MCVPGQCVFYKKRKRKEILSTCAQADNPPAFKIRKRKKNNVPGRRLEIAPTPFACTGHQGSPDEPKRFFFFPFFPNWVRSLFILFLFWLYLSRFGCYGITPARVRERERLYRVCGHVWTPPVWPCGSKAVGSFFSYFYYFVPTSAVVVCVCVCAVLHMCACCVRGCNAYGF